MNTAHLLFLRKQDFLSFDYYKAPGYTRNDNISSCLNCPKLL